MTKRRPEKSAAAAARAETGRAETAAGKAETGRAETAGRIAVGSGRGTTPAPATTSPPRRASDKQQVTDVHTM